MGYLDEHLYVLEEEDKSAEFQSKVHSVLTAVEKMLVEKNKAYGNSALDPIRVFSQADPIEQLKVRIDDKLSRIKKGSAAGEDVIDDLIGYLVIFKIATEKETV